MAYTQTNFSFVYLHDAADPERFINGIRMVPGAGWHPDLDLSLPVDQLYGGNGNYVFGTPIAGDYANNFPIAWRGGAVAASVTPGLYTFGLEILGGGDASANEVLATLDLTLEVVNRLEAAGTGTMAPSAISSGQTATAWMTVTNTGNRTLYSNARYQGFVPPGATDAVYGKLDVEFNHDDPFYFGEEIEAGGALTKAHSFVTARPTTPEGRYSLYAGWVGGNHVGDWHYLPMDPAPQVEVVPEPASLLALGLGLVGLASNRRRR